MSLEWYGVLAIAALLIIACLGWIDRPGKPPRPSYPEGCGAAARFCDSHTCECRWPMCDGNYHVCMCGADWWTDDN